MQNGTVPAEGSVSSPEHLAWKKHMPVFPHGREDTSGKMGEKNRFLLMSVLSGFHTEKGGNITTSLTWPSILFASSF